MGYSDDQLRVNVRLSRHNSEQDKADDAAFARLQVAVWKLIQSDPEYRRITLTPDPNSR